MIEETLLLLKLSQISTKSVFSPKSKSGIEIINSPIDTSLQLLVDSNES